MLKKVILLFLAIWLIFGLSGCSAKKKMEEKLAEKITEGVIGKMAGEDVKVDFDSGKINLKDKEGTEWSLGGGEWPKGEAAKQIPEFKKGNIESVIETSEGCMVYMTGVDRKDFERYMGELEKAGFTENAMNFSDSESVMYSAGRGNTATVSLVYSNDGNLNISVEIFK